MKKIACIGFFIFSGIVHAEWMLFDESQYKFFYVNPKVQWGNSTVKVCVMTDWKKPIQVDGKAVLSSESLEEFNCSEGRVRTLEVSFYSENKLTGKVIGSTKKNQPWHATPPRSISETLWRGLCKR